MIPATLGAVGHEPWWRRLAKQAAIAWPALRGEHRDLPLPAKDGPVDVGSAQKHAGVVDEVAGREVVRAVDDDVVPLQDLERILGGETLGVADDLDVRVDVVEPVGGAVQLVPSDVCGTVQDLALEVTRVHLVEVDDTDRADPRSGQVEGQRRSQPTRSHAKHPCGLELKLPFKANLRQRDMPSIAMQLAA